MLRFRVPSSNLCLAAVFEALEARKASLGVAEYACSQPRLEEIFHAITEGDAGEAARGGGGPGV